MQIGKFMFFKENSSYIKAYEQIHAESRISQISIPKWMDKSSLVITVNMHYVFAIFSTVLLRLPQLCVFVSGSLLVCLSVVYPVIYYKSAVSVVFRGILFGNKSWWQTSSIELKQRECIKNEIGTACDMTTGRLSDINFPWDLRVTKNYHVNLR